jgi:transposase
VVLRARISVWPGRRIRTSNCCPRRGEHAEQIPYPLDVPRRPAGIREGAMDLIYRNVAGLDVHRKTVVACVRRVEAGGRVREHVQTFGTMTGDLLRLSDWLAGHGVTHVAMESTGVLWKPVWNILDGLFELLLANPRELKQVPGRKSDVRDCQWITYDGHSPGRPNCSAGTPALQLQHAETG